MLQKGTKKKFENKVKGVSTLRQTLNLYSKRHILARKKLFTLKFYFNVLKQVAMRNTAIAAEKIVQIREDPNSRNK